MKGRGGVRSSYAGGLPTLCSTRSHCRPNSRTTEGSPRTHRCSPSIQCRAPGCPSPRTVQGEAETEGAARADPGSQAHAAAVGLAAAVAVEVQMVALGRQALLEAFRDGEADAIANHHVEERPVRGEHIYLGTIRR